jgi:hypothetical protein
MQPFRGTQKIVVERRHPDGTLDFRGEPQPPDHSMTFDRLYDIYFAETANASDRSTTASWEQLSTWLKSKGWSIRAKTW